MSMHTKTPLQQQLALDLWNQDVPVGSLVEVTLPGGSVLVTRTTTVAHAGPDGTPLVGLAYVGARPVWDCRAIAPAAPVGMETMITGDMDARRPQAG